MAVGSYTDVYTVDAYKQRVEQISSSIAGLKSGSFYIEGKKQLENQIQILKSKEEKIFEKLHVKNIEDLNKNLTEFRKSVINLSGPALYQSFIGILKEANALEYDAFNKAVEEVVIQDLLNGQSYMEVGKDYAYSAVMQALNQGVKSSKGIDVSFRSTKGFTNDGLFPAKFTNQQKKRWRELLATKYAKKGFKNVDRFLEIQANPTSTTSMTAVFSWLEETEQLTPTQAKELYAKNPEKINIANQRIKQEIINRTNDPFLIGQIVDYVLSKDITAFFVGRNENDITGILGEIQGLYYLAKFLGGNLTAAISWRGGLHVGTKGQKPHQDLLFEEFGIQVKNSTKDLVDIVSFANSSINDMLDKAGISDDARNVFLNYYGTEQFNIEYHWEGDRAAPEIDMSDYRADDFVRERNRLLNLSNDIDMLLSMFAASFMYMDIFLGSQKLDANTLFLIGGTAFQTASNLLSKILDDLDQQSRRFGINASLTLDRNIISALNDGQRGKEYSNLVLDNIKLTSSYNFHPRF